MKYYLRILASIVMLALLANCSAFNGDWSSDLESSQFKQIDLTAVDPAVSLAAYSATLEPIILQNCAGCHGSFQRPLFAVNDSQAAHDTLINSNLVNLQNPSSSKIVTKVKNGHSGISSSVASDMETAIMAWSSQLLSSQPDPVVDPTPTPEPGPVIEPEPTPVPQPDPVIVPEPTPTPDPVIDPTPMPEPGPGDGDHDCDRGEGGHGEHHGNRDGDRDRGNNGGNRGDHEGNRGGGRGGGRGRNGGKR